MQIKLAELENWTILQSSLNKKAAETFTAPVKVDIYDKGQLLGHADVTSIGDVNLQWQFEIEMRDWGIKGASVSIPDQAIELHYEYEIAEQDPTQDGYVPESKQIQLADVQVTGLDHVTWDAHLLPIMLEYNNGKWTVDFGQYNQYAALSKKDLTKKAGEMVADPYSALAVQVQNLKDRMSTVTERLQETPVEKVASDGAEMDVKELLEDITMGIAMVEEKMGTGPEDKETHPLVEEMGNLLMNLEKELGIVPTNSEEVPGANAESHRPDEMEVELQSSKKEAFTSGDSTTTTTVTNVNNAPGTTTAPTPTTPSNTNAPSEGDTPDASNPTCALCGGLSFASYAQYQDHMQFTHASDTMPTSPGQKNLSTVVGSKKTADVVTDETIITNDPNAVIPPVVTPPAAPVIQNVQPTDNDNLEVPTPKPSSPPPPGQIWVYNDVDKAYVAMPDPKAAAGKTI